MPVTSHKNYSQGKLTLKEIRKKETKDHNGNVIKFLQALMNYDHPVNVLLLLMLKTKKYVIVLILKNAPKLTVGLKVIKMSK